MKKATTAQQFIDRMNAESLRQQALAKAFDKAVEQFGARELALSLLEKQNTSA